MIELLSTQHAVYIHHNILDLKFAAFSKPFRCIRCSVGIPGKPASILNWWLRVWSSTSRHLVWFLPRSRSVNFLSLRTQVLTASQRIFQKGVGWVCMGWGLLVKNASCTECRMGRRIGRWYFLNICFPLAGRFRHCWVSCSSVLWLS